jgi:hypothetical protein
LKGGLAWEAEACADTGGIRAPGHLRKRKTSGENDKEGFEVEKSFARKKTA